MSAVTIRPEPPPAGDGLEYVPRPAPLWRPVQGAICQRQIDAQPDRFCQDPAVAEVDRALRGPSRWRAYCPRHMEEKGLWVEDGQVMQWVLVSKTGGRP